MMPDMYSKLENSCRENTVLVFVTSLGGTGKIILCLSLIELRDMVF